MCFPNESACIHVFVYHDNNVLSLYQVQRQLGGSGDTSRQLTMGTDRAILFRQKQHGHVPGPSANCSCIRRMQFDILHLQMHGIL